MSESARLCCIRIAGNTWNPCLLALRAKGYKLTLSFTRMANGEHRKDIDAEKDGRVFSATTEAELIGLIAMWEVRGDDWKTKPRRFARETSLSIKVCSAIVDACRVQVDETASSRAVS